jgi:hypothetical protein
MVAGRIGRTGEGPVAILVPMLMQGLRFFLLRFLPRRLVPILTAIEVVRLIQRLRRRGPGPVAPRRLVTVEGPDQAVVEDPIARR